MSVNLTGGISAGLGRTARYTVLHTHGSLDRQYELPSMSQVELRHSSQTVLHIHTGISPLHTKNVSRIAPFGNLGNFAVEASVSSHNHRQWQTKRRHIQVCNENNQTFILCLLA